MKKTLTIIAVIINCKLSILNCTAQTLTPKANPTSGGYSTGGGNTLSWTMGETFTTALSGGSNVLYQGEQQPYKRPTSVISGTYAICAGATSGNISITLTGVPPWNLTYTDGITPVTVTGIMASPYTFTVSPASTKTYAVSALSDINLVAEPAGRIGSALVTVNQLPVGSASAQVICDGGTSNVALTGGSTYTWTSSVTYGSVSGSSASGSGSPIAETLHNTSGTHGVVTYTVIPTSAAGCVGSSFTVNVTVGAIPTSPVVAGPNSVCGLTSAAYSATSTDATSYTWIAPAGLTITHGQGTPAITISIPGGTVGTTFTITATNACGTSPASNYIVTKKPQPAVAINGPVSLCGATTAAYNVSPVYGATSYTWLLPAGITMLSGAGTNSITVNVAGPFITGALGVYAVNGCGYVVGPSLTVYGAKPIAPNTLSGPANICGLTTAAYSTSVSTGASGYLWTVPPSMTIITGQGTSNITVSISNFTTGSISVAGTSECGTGLARTVALSVAATAPGTITGPTVTCGISTAAYSIAAVAGATGYNWTLPTGMFVTGGQNTTAITVSITNPPTGYVNVTANNGCANSTARTLTITKSSAIPGAITGPATGVCALGTAAYSIAAVSGATSYNWYLPSGMLLTSGGGTTRITVNSAATVSGTLKVNSQNACGTSGTTSMAISCANPIAMNSIEDKENSFSLYPNPATNEFTIEVTSNAVNNLVVEVYDVLGNLLKHEIHQLSSGTEIMKTNIEDFRDGIYFVRVLDKENNILYTQRVIKQ